MSKAAAKRDGLPPATDEVPEDLREAGWVLKEHVGDDSQFKCANKRLKLATSPYGTPFEAFEAARRLQAKEDKHSPKAPAAEEHEGPAPKGAVSRQFPMRLKTALSSEGLQQKCIEYDAACAEVEEMERNFKLIHDRHKEDLKVKQAEAEALSHVVRKQHVEEDVECEERMVYDERRVYVVRLDTGRAVESREMTEAETQQKLISI